MSNSIARHRAQAYAAQQGYCYYCHFEMCPDNPQAFAREHHISVPQAYQIRCTAEHLIARQDGGKNIASNIAAACWRCNTRRHARKCPPSADRYRAYVQKRVARGAWHDPLLFKCLRQSLHSLQ